MSQIAERMREFQQEAKMKEAKALKLKRAEEKKNVEAKKERDIAEGVKRYAKLAKPIEEAAKSGSNFIRHVYYNTSYEYTSTIEQLAKKDGFWVDYEHIHHDNTGSDSYYGPGGADDYFILIGWGEKPERRRNW